MTIFQDKLLTRTDNDEAGYYVVPNVLSPRDLVFSPDIEHKLHHHHIIEEHKALCEKNYGSTGGQERR